MWHINFNPPYTGRCFCFSNRNGAIIAATLGTILSCLIIIFSTIWLVLGAIHNEEVEEKSEYVTFNARVMFIAASVLALINLILCILLFCGIYLHKHVLMVPWLVIVLSYIVLFLPVSIFATIGSFNSELVSLRLSNEAFSRTLAHQSRYLNFYPVLIWIITTPIECYIWTVVFSAYKDIKDRNQEFIGFKRNTSLYTKRIVNNIQIGGFKDWNKNYSTGPVDI